MTLNRMMMTTAATAPIIAAVGRELLGPGGIAPKFASILPFCVVLGVGAVTESSEDPELLSVTRVLIPILEDLLAVDERDSEMLDVSCLVELVDITVLPIEVEFVDAAPTDTTVKRSRKMLLVELPRFVRVRVCWPLRRTGDV